MIPEWLSSDQIDLVGGFVLTILFFWFRFNSVTGTRSYTSAALYYPSLCCFILPFVTLYMIFVTFLSPILAVWVVIGVWLLPWIPLSWRNVCHRVAGIPSYAHTLKETLGIAPFAIPTEDTDVVLRKIGRYGFSI